MNQFKAFSLLILSFSLLSVYADLPKAPYDQYPDVEAPYYRVRYEASTQKGELIFPVKYTLWVPPEVKKLRGLIVHQHGCGEGSCKSGLTGAWDLHWQALARKHQCALISPSYEQPKGTDCQMWCDPRNGSNKAFLESLVDLGEQSNHPELSKVPWALWGHSGGGHWVGGMTLLYPERVAAVWYRSGVPLLEKNPDRSSIQSYSDISEQVLQVPMMCNPGTKEGVTDKTGRFAKVWPANENFLLGMRKKGALIGVSIDPLTAHECGNQRYMATAWLDSCLEQRLSRDSSYKLRPMSLNDVWYAPFLSKKAIPENQYTMDKAKASWLPNKKIAKIWESYVTDTAIKDISPPPSPKNLILRGNELSWEAEADLESGLSYFIILRDGEFLAKKEGPKNRYGRALFQGLQYSDTPSFPLQKMSYTDIQQTTGKTHHYKVISVNTVGLKSR